MPAFDRIGYPEFIGYKYASCLTCHYNGQGNGPLNDYGRALWATEIAGRAFAKGRTDEQLGEASGILGSKQLPWWIRPGVKARELLYLPSPGGNGKIRSILMQLEANLALFFDRDQKFAFVGSYGYAPIPQRLQNTAASTKVDEGISREHYLRWQTSENLWLYAGLMDKVYGIRISNHTAYSRAKVGLAQNDQAHGIVAHYIQPTWELSLNGFLGNLYQDEALRQKGASTLFEYEVAEAWRLGASALYSNNNYVGNRRMAVHSRSGLGHGSAILFELGLIENAPKSGTSSRGYYMFSEAIQRVARGYHAFASGQMYKDRLESGRPDILKASFGVLAFPMQRVEFRFEMENQRSFTDSSSVSRDGWAVMSQVHLSL
ncbi:MAG: hypothetical protein HC902_04895 [Calothrix sp. SM1_5_4]|nr:hypothetical protein [Calothrix sp. SM1_5_4]